VATSRRPKAAVTVTAAGTDLVLTRGFLGIAALLLISALLPAGFADVSNWLGGASFALIYAGSVTLHESAHALAAAGRGFRVTAVRLTWTGGETQYEGDADDQLPPPIIPAAGLLASALAAAGFVAIVVAEGSSGNPSSWVGYVTFAAEVNVLLAVVNALPLSGSDGSFLYGRFRAGRAR
jgi:peptidase M50B-like protein